MQNENPRPRLSFRQSKQNFIYKNTGANESKL